MTEFSYASVEVPYPKISGGGREYRTGWWRPAPEDDGPIPEVPLKVEWGGEAWDVIDVDRTGRWLLLQEEDDYEYTVHIERYADPSQIYVPPVRDARPAAWAQELGWMDRILREVYLPEIKAALERDWMRALFGDRAE